jgi:hypothetical protein
VVSALVGPITRPPENWEKGGDRLLSSWTAVVAGDAGAFSDIFDLPDASGPRFVINATSVQTGALFRFSKP